MGIDINLISSDKLITENVIRKFAEKHVHREIDLSDFINEPIIIFGGGGHAKTIIDLLRQQNEYSIVGIVDDDPALDGNKIMGVPVLGTRSYLPYLRNKGIKYAVNCIGGILDINIRLRITIVLQKEGFLLAVLIHPSATLEPSAIISAGAQILANSYIGSDVLVGDNAIINTNSVISHDCRIGNHTHIAPGCLLAGNVSVGDRTLIGMGVTTSIGINIGSDVRIGNGTILLADVPDHTIIQAGSSWVGKSDR